MFPEFWTLNPISPKLRRALRPATQPDGSFSFPTLGFRVTCVFVRQRLEGDPEKEYVGCGQKILKQTQKHVDATRCLERDFVMATYIESCRLSSRTVARRNPKP